MNGTVVDAKGKPSRDVVILGVIVMLYSLQGLPGNFDFYVMKFRDLPEKMIVIRYVFSLALRASLFLAGAGLLFRKEIFRKIVVGICWFTLLTVYWKHPFPAFKNSLMFNLEHGVISADLLPKIDGMAWASVAICSFIDIVMTCFLIYLFTRPGIKKQFR